MYTNCLQIIEDNAANGVPMALPQAYLAYLCIFVKIVYLTLFLAILCLALIYNLSAYFYVNAYAIQGNSLCILSSDQIYLWEG